MGIRLHISSLERNNYYLNRYGRKCILVSKFLVTHSYKIVDKHLSAYTFSTFKSKCIRKRNVSTRQLPIVIGTLGGPHLQSVDMYPASKIRS